MFDAVQCSSMHVVAEARVDRDALIALREVLAGERARCQASAKAHAGSPDLPRQGDVDGQAEMSKANDVVRAAPTVRAAHGSSEMARPASTGMRRSCSDASQPVTAVASTGRRAPGGRR